MSRARLLPACSLLALAATLPLNRPALALFNPNGTDNFPGTQLDPQTWNPTHTNGTPSFTQNNGLTIHASSAWGFYTTTSPLVPVGGSTWAEVRINTSNGEASAAISLDTNSAGVFNFLQNSVDLDLTAGFNQGLPSFNSVMGGERQTLNGNETGYGPTATLLPSSPISAATYIFQIERLSSSNVQYSLFSELGPAPTGGTLINFIASGTQNFVTSADPMYVNLEAEGTDTTFLSVTVNHPIAFTQTTVLPPDPAPLAIALLIAPALFPRRRPSPRT